MKKPLASLLAVVVLAAPALALAEGQGMEHMDHAKMEKAEKAEKAGKTATITGEILDSACYMSHGAHGEKHADCAAKCISNGAPMTVLTDKGVLYLLVANHDNEDAYAQAKGLASKRVELTGTLVEKGGMKTLIVDSVKEASADKKM